MEKENDENNNNWKKILIFHLFASHLSRHGESVCHIVYVFVYASQCIFPPLTPVRFSGPSPFRCQNIHTHTHTARARERVRKRYINK